MIDGSIDRSRYSHTASASGWLAMAGSAITVTDSLRNEQSDFSPLSPESTKLGMHRNVAALTGAESRGKVCG